MSALASVLVGILFTLVALYVADYTLYLARIHKAEGRRWAYYATFWLAVTAALFQLYLILFRW